MNKPRLPNIREKANPSGKRVYMLDYFDVIENKRVRVVIGSRKHVAQAKANQIYNQMMEIYIGIPEKKKEEITVEDLLIAFFINKENRVSPSTTRRYKIYESHLIDFFKKDFKQVIYIHQIKKEYIDLHLQQLFRARKALKTVNGHLAFIQALFIFAVDEGYLVESPVKRIKPFPLANDKTIDFWTKKEITLILETVDSHWRDHFSFLFNTGLRKGELMNLTWNDVDLKSNPPKITIQAKDDWHPKTNTFRSIPLNEEAIEVIKRQAISDQHNYVFKGVEGNKVHRDRIYKALKNALDKLNLDGNVHKFRHTFASHLVMAGVGLETVSKLLGHSTIEMTMKYAHLAPDHLRKAVNLLNLD